MRYDFELKHELFKYFVRFVVSKSFEVGFQGVKCLVLISMMLQKTKKIQVYIVWGEKEQGEA